MTVIETSFSFLRFRSISFVCTELSVSTYIGLSFYNLPYPFTACNLCVQGMIKKLRHQMVYELSQGKLYPLQTSTDTMMRQYIVYILSKT